MYVHMCVKILNIEPNSPDISHTHTHTHTHSKDGSGKSTCGTCIYTYMHMCIYEYSTTFLYMYKCIHI